MADTIASPVLQSLLNRLDSFCGSFDEGDEMLTRLRSVVATVKDLAAVAEQRFEMVEEIKRWLAEVKHLGYELDYLLDDYEQQLRKVMDQNLIDNCFCFQTRNENQQSIEPVLEELTALASKGYWPLESNWRPDLYFRLYSGSSFSRLEPEIVGRELDREKIISLLLSKSEQVCQVISIVGEGGMGKTSLARLVYNDERVTRNFCFKYWVSLGNNHYVDVERIGAAICSWKFLSLNDLEDGVRRELLGKRFLIVLDNLWDEEMNQWITLRKWFSVGSPGSAVIVTTRSTAAADSISSMPLYYLRPLLDADCLDMFWKVASLPREEEGKHNIEMLQLSKTLVANCRGLPLAVKILGALLPYNGETDNWLSAAALAFLELEKYSYSSDVLPVLRLSYDLLPSNLKQCFTYCSMFPREFWLSKEKLIQLWNAEGFLQTSGSSGSLDDIAEDCFMKLLQRLFFEDVVRDDSGNILCRMHDLVYDFALTISSSACSVMGIGSLKNVSAEVRHCSLVFESEPSAPLRYLSKPEDLQTLLLLSSKFDTIPDTFFSRLSHLHVLDFSQSGIRELPVTLGALKHLRFLDLSQTHIRKIPESISTLMYLQTLKLSDCYNLEELPQTVPQLTNLVNLDISSCCSLTYLPSGIGKLRLLEKLPIFVLGKGSDTANLNELSGLDLKESLEIKNLENVTKEEDAQDAKLFNKVSLHSLGLSWCHNNCMDFRMSTKILENLNPPQNLRDFCLKGYRGDRIPTWMFQGLPNLLKISLINCGFKKLPPLGQLPFLKVLYLKGLSEVRTICHEFYGDGIFRGFPCLEQLEMYDMPNLEEWKNKQIEKTEIFTAIEGSAGPLSHEAFPRLDKLVVKGCQRLTALPVIPNLRSLALCDSNVMLLCSVVYLPSLSSLVIEKSKDLGFGSFTDYIKSFCTIEKLTLYDCDCLPYLFDGNPAFSSLKHLSILYCDRLMSLPLGLRFLTSLQRFDVMECGQLNDISVLQSLSSLQELIIMDCPMLHSVPSGRHILTNLQRLVIRGCPALQRHLEMQNGKDCFNVANIPYVEIEYRMLSPKKL